MERMKFSPFHAINEFMVDEYRHKVIHFVLSKLDQLEPGRRGAIVNMIKGTVKIPGFRNPAAAPLSIKVRGTASAFEKNPMVVAQILSAWSELQPELRLQVHDMLKARGWDVLPAEADRSRLPGFMITWPKGEDYDKLDEDFAGRYPGVEVAVDDVRLMAVWIGGRLPFTADEEEETGEAS